MFLGRFYFPTYQLCPKNIGEVMTTYYINKNAQSNGDHEVHVPSCSYFPQGANAIRIGDYTNCHDAVAAAKVKWPGSKINGCYYCCNPCHTT